MVTLAQTGGMGWFSWFWMIVLLGLGGFMILLVLLQRGRGGGLVGALGGAGGQSAFGTRAGDVFTKITVVVATLWVITAGVGGIALRNAATAGSSSLPSQTETAPVEPDQPVASTVNIDDADTTDDAAPADTTDEATSEDAVTAPALPETTEETEAAAEPSGDEPASEEPATE